MGFPLEAMLPVVILAFLILFFIFLYHVYRGYKGKTRTKHRETNGFLMPTEINRERERRYNRMYQEALDIIRNDKDKSLLLNQSVSHLQHDNRDVRALSLVIIGTLVKHAAGQIDPILADKIMHSLEDQDPFVRQIAIEAVVVLSKRLSKDFSPCIEKLLGDNDPDVRWNAAHYLKQLGSEAVREEKPVAQSDRPTNVNLLGRIDLSSWINESLTISPNNRHFAYMGEVWDKGRLMYVIVDGKEVGRYKSDGGVFPFFSPDSNRIAWGFNKPYWFTVIDGEIKQESESLDAPKIKFSPDSKQVAYCASMRRKLFSRKKWNVVVNGQRGKAYDEITNLNFTSNSQAISYAARQNKEWFVMIDNQEYGPYESIGEIVFSPDSMRAAFTARKNRAWIVVADSQEIGNYIKIVPDTICFSHDGKKIAFAAAMAGGRRLVTTDSNENTVYDNIGSSTVRFSPNSLSIAYAARKGNYAFLVIDGKEGQHYDSVGVPVFSTDSRHIAYGAVRGRKQFVVIDGKEQRQYDAIIDGSITFSPRGKHLVYAAQTGEKQVIVADNNESIKGYDSFVSIGGGKIIFDSEERFRFIVASHGDLYLVQEEIAP